MWKCAYCGTVSPTVAHMIDHQLEFHKEEEEAHASTDH